MKKILITAFNPFGGKTTNASLDVLKNLDFNLANVNIYTMILPTVFSTVEDVLLSKIDLVNPDIILLLGEAGNAKAIRVERVAINIDDARIPDNLGRQPIDQAIKKDGHTAYFSNLPIKNLVKDLNQNHIHAVVSNTAGTFVCNHIMYLTLDYLHRKKADNTIAGFIHFPYIHNQNDLNTYTDGLKIIIKSCLDHISS